MLENNHILSFNHCSKAYPGVKAIDDICLDIRKGEVHALVGENGAGKSTLIKCLSGAVKQDSGTIVFDGINHPYMTPSVSRDAGIEVIYQELNLVNSLTIAENVCFGKEYKKYVDYKLLNKKAAEAFAIMQVRMDVTKTVSELPIAQQQLVEIAKSISKNAKLIVMDEPTAPLTVDEIEVLFAIIERLKKNGVTIIYISHRLDEIFRICDRATVMRDGRIVKTLNVKDTNRKELIEYMVGRTFTESYPSRRNICTEKALELDDVSGNGDFNINMVVHRGEIVGLAGLVGSGRTELVRMIYGADKIASGKIKIYGHETIIRSPRQAIQKGIGLIPENRKEQGCFLNFGIDWNITISNIRNLSRFSFMNFMTIDQQATEYINALHIKTPGKKQLAMNLSGGNQQKVAIAKTLATGCSIILFDEPTRGIDVGAKQEIYRLMTSLADEGHAILMVTSDMEELLGMSDRIYVLAEGRIRGEISKAEATQVRLMEMMSVESKER